MAKTTKKAEPAAVKTEEIKTVKTETVKTEPVAKKATKTAEKKPAAKKTATAEAVKAPAVKLFVEYQGRQVSQEDILAAVMAKAGKAKNVEIYVKPEDGAAYYVADGEPGKVGF